MTRYLATAIALLAAGCTHQLPQQRTGDWQCVGTSCKSEDEILYPRTKDTGGGTSPADRSDLPTGGGVIPDRPGP